MKYALPSGLGHPNNLDHMFVNPRLLVIDLVAFTDCGTFRVAALSNQSGGEIQSSQHGPSLLT